MTGGSQAAHTPPDQDYCILEQSTGSVVDRCRGPERNGACPRVPIGAVIPCAGCALVRMREDGMSHAYNVSPQMTLCPITLAHALEASSATDLIPW